ncbi:MAG: sigma factor, partial [Tannerellaceae bacterium]
MNVSDKTYYESLFKKHYCTLCNYAYNILSDSQIAEDIVQNYFVHIWEKKHLP